MAALSQQLPRDKNVNIQATRKSDVFPRLLLIMRLQILSVMEGGVVFDKNSWNPYLALVLVLWLAYKFRLHLEDTANN